MKITYKWLNDYVSLDGLSPEQIAEELTNRGIPVEMIEYRNKGIEGIVIGEVLATEQHPNADRLRVCQVNAGTGETLQIVCGAPNVKAGQKVPVALVGATLPDLQIKKAKLRGVESQGMLCSAKEIGLDGKLLPKEQTEGLYILPEDAPVGESIVSYLELDDCILDLELTPNRSDCLSLRGVAYEVGAIFGREVHMPTLPDHSNALEAPLSVRIESDNCQYYAGQVVDRVAVMPAPVWMQMRLLSVGVRPINLIVDVTNYCMLEYGQPLHAFDYDTIAEQTIVVRNAKEEETLVTLDGQLRTLQPSTLVIADPTKALGLAGVMGGENSEVRTQTNRIVIESAVFDPGVVRTGSKQFGLRSEAATRFEKGVDPEIVNTALSRATSLMVEYGGAAPIGNPVTAGDTVVKRTQITITVDRINQILGTDISKQTVLDIFQTLGLTVMDQQESSMTVEIPSRRPDLTIAVDLIEEVARMYGYDNIPTTFPNAVMSPGRLNVEQTLRRTVRSTMVGLGLHEVYTYPFVSSDLLQKLGETVHQVGEPIRLALPMSEERSVLRTSLLPSLLEVIQYNVNRKNTDLQLFEIGKTYANSGTDSTVTDLPTEKFVIAAAFTGKVDLASIGTAPSAVDFYDVKGIAETLLDTLGVVHVQFVATQTISYLHPTQTASIQVGDTHIGMIGALHPEMEQRFDIPKVYYLELDLAAIQSVYETNIRFQSLPKYPSIERDVALVVDQHLHTDVLLQSIRTTGAPLVRNARVFDVYQGEQLPEGKKSVAIAVEYRAPDRTLTDAEIQDVHQSVLDTLAREYRAELRA